MYVVSELSQHKYYHGKKYRMHVRIIFMRGVLMIFLMRGVLLTRGVLVTKKGAAAPSLFTLCAY